MSMMHAVTIFLLVCINNGLSKPIEEETELSYIANSDSNKSQASSIPSDVESRFFDLGGVINQLFPGFNQGGAGGRPGLNLPSNSQFYPGGVPAQNWNPLLPINQGNGRYPNQQNIERPLFQNQGTPSDINFNQQGSINNINQPEQYLNQPGLGQNPANLNGNLMNGGENQRRQPGNLQNSGFQQSRPSQLGGQQGQGRPEYDIGAFEYPGRKPANPNQGASNFNNNSPPQNNNRPPQNQYPKQEGSPNGQDLEINPGNQNGMPTNQRPQNPSNQAQNSDQKQPNNMNQYPNVQQQGINDNNLPNQGFPANQYQQGANNRGQNNLTPPQGNVNNNLPPNVNEQGPNLNNNRPNQQVPQSKNNQNPQGVQINPGQASSGNSNAAITFPDYDGDDFEETRSTQAETAITTMAPTTTSTGNAIRGKPVLIPTSTVSPDQVVFVNSDTPTAYQKECVQNCPTSSEYNPVCGTDNVSYFNPGRLLCARNCGIRVFESRKGNCDRNK